MNTHFEITDAKEKQSENYLNRKVGLSSQIVRITQYDNEYTYVLGKFKKYSEQ